MTCPFQHQPLHRARREIRLLELLPKTQWPTDFLPTCSILHSSIDECPPYIALSYVWGDKRDQREIVVNGCSFEVTKNLFEALIGIAGSETIIIWIDAICINQVDNEEKGWQVALMGEIYRNTSEVVAWLGPSEDNSDMVMDRLNALGSIAELCGLHTNILPTQYIWEATMKINPTVAGLTGLLAHKRLLPTYILIVGILLHAIGGFDPHEYLIRVADLDRLFRRPWWGRVWVLQEISLPKQAQFVCGTKRISRQRFYAAFEAYHAFWEVLSSKLRQNQLLSNYQKELLPIAPIRVHLMLSMSKVYQTKDYSLVEILRATSCQQPAYDKNWGGSQSLDATDPRDKIFALLNIVNDKEELDKFHVHPDYKNPKDEIYTTVMLAMLRQGNISLLSQACGVTRTGRLPSWVPDWSKPSLGTLQYYERDYMSLKPRFCAFGSEEKICFAFKNHNIMIKGTICDQILHQENVNRISGLSKCAYPLEWLHLIVKLTRLVQELYLDSRVCLGTAARVLHAGMKFHTSGLLERENLFPQTIGLLKKVSLDGEKNDGLFQLHKTLQRFGSLDPTRNGLTDEDRAIHDILRISEGRSPFITVKGRLGIGSMEVKEGDVVALFSGVQTPFILRPVGERFMIVSEAYVDGIMDGEAEKDSPWGFIELE